MRLVHRVAQLALLHHHAHCHPVLLVQVRNRWRHSPFADLQHLLERVFVDVVAAQHEPARCKHPQNSVRDLGHQLPMLPLPPASSPRSRQDQRSRPPDLARTPPPRSLLAKYRRAKFGKLVTIRFPSSSPGSLYCPTGTCTCSLHRPNPSSASTFTPSSPSSKLSSTISRPVIPKSTLPLLTYFAISDAGRNTSTTFMFVEYAISCRGFLLNSSPILFSNSRIFSKRRPFFGTASISNPSIEFILIF
ncbi:hypothetical protein AYI70_g2686 [Smittium culicis]|uniref:Uncharacterized protein n=1 Tax=Smittium culicis TaxID=133412 RepID=A0A1R1X6I5_9FUNG|nr:hypothetical protein AYI70_g10447 [Smittium culicis]OMJ22737.1 hypothetical protein AYI70_g2686 [Smittium culicis]